MIRIAANQQRIMLRAEPTTMLPRSLPTRREGVYLALVAGIGQGEQFLRWSDEALELLASVDTEP